MQGICKVLVGSAPDRPLQRLRPVAPPANLGKYRLIAELGQGGMADVYLAKVAGPTGSGFTKLAVIKRLRPNLVEDPEFVAMLVDEARISARLNHPNVVQTLEVGFEHEEYYLAMEFLDGQPLHRVQRRAARTGTVLPRELACLVVADVLSGLHHAHELADYDGSPLGVVHRDVNPQNVFLTYDGTVKVVDFGIAKAAGRVAETKHGVVKGKVRYMSPEQALGGTIDRRSDIFAAGLLLWEAATGKRFGGEMHDLDISHALVTGDFDPSPRSVDPTVPAALDAMCRKALSSPTELRYATTGELRDDLEAFLSESLVSARRRLGALVAGMFVKERADVRAVIQRASLASEDAPSMAVLLGSTQTNRLQESLGSAPSPSGISPASIAPVLMDSRPNLGPSAPLAAQRRRPRAGTMVAVAAMVASSLVLAVELGHPGRAPLFGAAATARQPSELAFVHARFERETAPTKVDVPLVTHSAGAPRPPHAPAALAAAPRKEASAAAPVASAVPSARPEGRHRPKATIDTADPWSQPDEDAK